MMSPTDPLNIEGMLAFVSVRMMTLDDWIATDRARLPDQPSGLHVVDVAVNRDPAWYQRMRPDASDVLDHALLLV